jgi:hypothetical protein
MEIESGRRRPKITMISLIKIQFKGKRNTAVQETALKSTSGSPKAKLSSSQELKDVSNFELFDGKGYLQHIKAIEEKDDLFVNFSCLNKDFKSIGHFIFLSTFVFINNPSKSVQNNMIHRLSFITLQY